MAPWRRLAIECVNYLSILSFTSTEVLSDFPEGKNEITRRFLQSQFSLTSRASLDIRSIIDLIDNGYGTQADIISSSTAEVLELAAAIWIDREIAVPFYEADTHDKANKFWHAYLSKGKVRKIIEKFLLEEVPNLEDSRPEHMAWKSQTGRYLGATKHPSYFTPFLHIFSEIEEDVPYHPIEPILSPSSVATYQHIADHCVELANVILLSVVRRSSRPNSRKRRFFEDEALNSYAERGHKFMQKLWIYYLENQDRHPFSLWRDLEEAGDQVKGS